MAARGATSNRLQAEQGAASGNVEKKELLDIIDPVLQHTCNGYFGHPENLLFAMISDKNIRELGLRRILKARLEKS